MSEFVGRTGSNRVYSYPETRRSGGLSDAFARNFASGPKGVSAVGAGIQIQWNSIDSTPDPTPDEDVPITPAVTGIVLISGVVMVTNTSGAPVVARIEVQLDDVSLPVPNLLTTTVPDNSTVAIPFLTETTPSDTPIGVPTNVQIFVTGTGLDLVSDSSTLSVQEVSAATG